MEKEKSCENKKEGHRSLSASTRASSGGSSVYIVMIAMLCLLLVFSVVQAVQITQLKATLQNGAVANLAAASQSQPTPQTAQRPAAQPQMVGGC